MSEGLLIERLGAVLRLTINRDERRNAIDSVTSAAIDHAVDEAEADPAINVILLTGEGDHAFCAGMDMKEAADVGAGKGLIPGRGFAGLTERRRTKPLVVAINGAAVAGGFEIALAADLVIAADHAIFALIEVKRGLFAFAGGVQRLARAVPRAAALALVLTGEPIDAQRAFALGLVSELVPGERLQARALEIAQMIASFDPVTVRRALLLHDMAAAAPIDESLRFGRAFGEETLQTGASLDRIAAFAVGAER